MNHTLRMEEHKMGRRAIWGKKAMWHAIEEETQRHVKKAKEMVWHGRW